MNTTVCDCGGSAEKASIRQRKQTVWRYHAGYHRSMPPLSQAEGIEAASGIEGFPVIGGHSGVTILPLCCRRFGVSFTEQEAAELTKRSIRAPVLKSSGRKPAADRQPSLWVRLPHVSVFSGSRSARAKRRNAPMWKATVSMPVFFSQPLLLGKNDCRRRKSIGTLGAFEHSLDAMLDTLKRYSVAWVKIFINK